MSFWSQCPSCGTVTSGFGKASHKCDVCEARKKYQAACDHIVEKYYRSAVNSVCDENMKTEEWIQKYSKSYIEAFYKIAVKVDRPIKYDIPSPAFLWTKAEKSILDDHINRCYELTYQAIKNGRTRDEIIREIETKSTGVTKRLMENSAFSYDKIWTVASQDYTTALDKKARITNFLSFSVVSRGMAALMLLLALGDLDDDYYTILRFIVCAVSFYCAHISYTVGEKYWIWSFGLFAAFFNPFIPLHFERETWSIFDVLGSVFLRVSMIFIREKKDV